MKLEGLEVGQSYLIGCRAQNNECYSVDSEDVVYSLTGRPCVPLNSQSVNLRDRDLIELSADRSLCNGGCAITHYKAFVQEDLERGNIVGQYFDVTEFCQEARYDRIGDREARLDSPFCTVDHERLEDAPWNLDRWESVFTQFVAYNCEYNSLNDPGNGAIIPHPPLAPIALGCEITSSTSNIFNWFEPLNTGSDIQKYTIYYQP